MREEDTFGSNEEGVPCCGNNQTCTIFIPTVL